MTYSEQGGDYPMKGNIDFRRMMRRVASSYRSKKGSFRLSPREKSKLIKTAARPIRLDRGRIEKLLDRLYRQLEPFGSGPKRVQRVGVQRNPIAMDSIVVRDVFGNDKKVHVALTAEPGTGGPVLSGGFGHFNKGRHKGEPIIIVQMNGSYDWEGIATSKVSRDSLRSVLMHELTHAADKPVKKTDKQKNRGGQILTWGEVDQVEYANNPAEVRAYMREIYEEITPFVRKVMNTPLGKTWGLGGTITRSLRTNKIWETMEPHLTRQNRNRILKGLVTAFQDEGLGEGYKESSDLFRSRARLASRFVTDRSGRKHKLPRYLYQVTYLKDLDSIQSSGIRAGRGQTFGGGYGGHSAGRVFFADEDGVSFWFDRYGMLAENKTDTPEDGWWPVVLRVPTSKIREEFNYDSPGSKDSYSLSVFIEPERGISSNIIEVFDPFSGSWTSLDSVDVDDWLDEAQSEGAEEESDGEDSWVIVDFDYFAPY